MGSKHTEVPANQRRKAFSVSVEGRKFRKGQSTMCENGLPPLYQHLNQCEWRTKIVGDKTVGLFLESRLSHPRSTA